MKGILPILLGLAAMGYSADVSGGGNHVEPLTDAELARMRERMKYAEIERLIAQGHKWFDIEGTPILALNKKNAIRKFNKQNPL